MGGLLCLISVVVFVCGECFFVGDFSVSWICGLPFDECGHVLEDLFFGLPFLDLADDFAKFGSASGCVVCC